MVITHTSTVTKTTVLLNGAEEAKFLSTSAEKQQKASWLETSQTDTVNAQPKTRRPKVYGASVRVGGQRGA